MSADRTREADQQRKFTPVESRQAVTGHNVNIVLLVSLTLAVLAGLTFLASFSWNALP